MQVKNPKSKSDRHLAATFYTALSRIFSVRRKWSMEEALANINSVPSLRICRLVICNSPPTLRGQQFVTGTGMFKEYINSAVDWPVVGERYFFLQPTEIFALPLRNAQIMTGIRCRYYFQFNYSLSIDYI